jgi:spore photoproduct lyase
MRQSLESWHKNLGLYLCMESDDVWEKSMGWSPKDSNGLRHYLDERVREIFDSNR